MVIRVATDLRCGNKIRHATAEFPPATVVINDPMVGSRSWFLRCGACVDALELDDDPDPYLVAYLHGHDPTADPRPDPAVHHPNAAYGECHHPDCP